MNKTAKKSELPFSRILSYHRSERSQNITGKILILALIYTALVLIRLKIHTFGVSLGYLYLIFIYLGGCWFGLSGGILTALISILTFCVETHIFHHWLYRDFVVQNLPIRVLAYLLSGFLVGFLSRRQEILENDLRREARFDKLTGCVNYQHFIRLLQKEIKRSSRSGEKFSIIMIDLDGFKIINDRHGHIFGNMILSQFGSHVMSNLRDIDIVGRFGGDEFIVLLPYSSGEEALKAVERIRENLLERKFGMEDDAIPLSFCAGVSTFPDNAELADELLLTADNCLYQSKADKKKVIIAERRQRLRLKPVTGLRIELKLPGTDYSPSVQIENISMKGIGILMTDGLPTDNISLRLFLPDDPDGFDLEGHVVYNTPVKLNEFRMGICFAGESQLYQDSFRGFFESNIKRFQIY